MDEERKVPEGAVFTLTVPRDRSENPQKAVFYLKEMTEEVFMAAKTFINQKKTFDAVRLIIQALSLPGSDSVELLKGPNGFIALNAAGLQIIELLDPLEGELKKN